MKTHDYVLAKFLGCDVFDNDKLDSILVDVDELFEAASEKTLDGFGEATYNLALAYLTNLYQFAVDTIKAKPDLYLGSVLEWDSDLLIEALNSLDPKTDLHWGFDSTCFYLELDFYDLYWSVVETINDDYDSGYSFKTFDNSFTDELWGGKPTPTEYKSLLF